MKNEKSIKIVERQESSIKGKSTNESITQDDKIKSIKQNKKIIDIPSIKRGKNVVLYIKNNHEKNKVSTGFKSNKKIEKVLNNKNTKLNKVTIGKKLVKTLFKNKTEAKIDNTVTKKKTSAINKTPSPAKKKLKPKKSLLLLSTWKNKKDNKFINNTFRGSNYIKRSSKALQDEYLTMQNTIKNKKIHRNPNVYLGNQVKKLRKFSLDLNRIKNKLYLEKIENSYKTLSVPIKHYKKNINNIKTNLNNTFTLKNYIKNISNKNKTINNERNKSNEKAKLIKKMSKTKFIFSNLVYRNKIDTVRDKLISVSSRKKDKNKNSLTIPRSKKIKIPKNKEIDEFNNTHNTFKNDLELKQERNSFGESLNFKNNYKTVNVSNYLKNENNSNYNKKLSCNINYNNKNNLRNYLKITVCAKNKIVNYKKKGKIKENKENKDNKDNKDNKENTNNSLEKKRCKTIEKDIKSLKSRNEKKNYNNLINRHTINRLKIENQNQNINNKSISNRSTISNSSRISNNKIDEYIIIKELGKGSYATVKLGLHKITREKYAIKIYSKKSILDPQKKNTVNNEINILKQLNNINIMKLYKVIDSPNYLYLIMEYIDGISLLDTIRKDSNHYFEEKRALNIFIQVLKAMIYCQEKNICHRDIKLENILIKKNDVIKIIDFGFSVKTDKETYQDLFCGSPSYMAPEIINKEKYIAQYSDIWSLGVLFFTMLFGRFPFKAKTQEELFNKINKGQIAFPKDIEINEKIKILLKKIFVREPAQRPSLQEILNDILLLIESNL